MNNIIEINNLNKTFKDIKAVDELMNYIEKNPKILQNPNILDFCIEIKKIKGEVK